MNITPNDLHEFTGTENYFKTMDKSIVYTDGVQYFARTLVIKVPIGFWI